MTRNPGKAIKDLCAEKTMSPAELEIRYSKMFKRELNLIRKYHISVLGFKDNFVLSLNVDFSAFIDLSWIVLSKICILRQKPIIINTLVRVVFYLYHFNSFYII